MTTATSTASDIKRERDKLVAAIYDIREKLSEKRSAKRDNAIVGLIDDTLRPTSNNQQANPASE